MDLVEVWVMDSPNHGRAAVLNDAKLLKSGKGVSECFLSKTSDVQKPMKYLPLAGSYTVADGLHQLVKSGLLKGNKIVAAGHSAGAGCVCVLLYPSVSHMRIVLMTPYRVLSTKAFPLDHIPYASIILLEPHMMPRHIVKWMQKNKGSQPTPLQVLAESAKTRKDTWPSREAAQQWFAKRYPWKLWDQRALRLFVVRMMHPCVIYPSVICHRLTPTIFCAGSWSSGHAYRDIP